MSRRVTVADLKAVLEDYDDQLEVRIVHQQHYPLVEVLGGVWQADPDACAFEGCGLAKLAPLHLEADERYDHEFEAPSSSLALYLVANGHPRGDDDSPYGDRTAWDDMVRLG